MQAAASQNDFITPSVVSAAEADYERNLANTVELLHMLAHDPQHAAANGAIFTSWLSKYGALALDAVNNLQPIWSQPRVKVASFPDALDHAKNRVKAICGEIGIAPTPSLAG